MKLSHKNNIISSFISRQYAIKLITWKTNSKITITGALPNSSHLVSPQSDLLFGSRSGLKIFIMATLAAILDIGTE